MAPLIPDLPWNHVLHLQRPCCRWSAAPPPSGVKRRTMDSSLGIRTCAPIGVEPTQERMELGTQRSVLIINEGCRSMLRDKAQRILKDALCYATLKDRLNLRVSICSRSHQANRKFSATQLVVSRFVSRMHIMKMPG